MAKEYYAVASNTFLVEWRHVLLVVLDLASSRVNYEAYMYSTVIDDDDS